MIQMDIQTVVVANGPGTSLIVLKPRTTDDSPSLPTLPIKIGFIEANQISMGIDTSHNTRPLTHDLLLNAIESLGGHVSGVKIVDVKGTTFFARVMALSELGRSVELDARPSDAIALAVRAGVPIFAEEKVLDKAAFPDFKAVEEDEREHELERFHEFVETLTPDDFSRSK